MRTITNGIIMVMRALAIMERKRKVHAIVDPGRSF
jgi:hypothetical protein